MEQKFVQRCETKVDADACKASYREIQKAVGLTFDWVPKLIQKFVPTMEQKLVQRCETEVVADACNAS